MKRSLTVAAVALFALVSFSASSQASNTRMTNGDIAKGKNWPFHVAIVNREDKVPLFVSCNGALIAPRWVVTASTCVLPIMRPIDPQGISYSYDAIIGRSNLVKKKQGERIKIEQMFVNPRYNFDYNTFAIRGNVMLLRLSSSSKQRPVRVSGSKMQVGSRGRVAGFGDLSDNGFFSPRKLRSAPVVLQNPTNCSDLYGPTFSSADQYCFFAGKTNKPSYPCAGDQADPIVSGGKLYAIGTPFSTCHNPEDLNLPLPANSLFPYRKWIKMVPRGEGGNGRFLKWYKPFYSNLLGVETMDFYYLLSQNPKRMTIRFNKRACSALRCWDKRTPIVIKADIPEVIESFLWKRECYRGTVRVVFYRGHKVSRGFQVCKSDSKADRSADGLRKMLDMRGFDGTPDPGLSALLSSK